jgi:hypothetical protein
MRTFTVWLSALGIVFGFIAAYVDLHTKGMLITALLLLAFGFALGYWQPQGAWRWGLVLGIWVPIAQVTARLADGTQPLNAILLMTPLIAFVPAFAGVYLAVLTRRLASRKPAVTES